VTSTGKAAEAEVAYIDAGKTLRQAGHLMRELGVTALRVRGKNGKVQGTISRDMVVRRIAAGADPKTVTVGEVAAVPPYIPARPDDSRGARQLPGLVALSVVAAGMVSPGPLASAA
jgi:CBS domain-containing protein